MFKLDGAHILFPSLCLTNNCGYIFRLLTYMLARCRTLQESAGGDSGGLSKSMLAVVLSVTLCLFAILLAGLAALVILTRVKKRLTIFGHRLRPGPSPDTTLVVTDIQDSTAL